MWDGSCMLPTCSEQEILADITNIEYVISIKNENMCIRDRICKFRWMGLAGDGSPMTSCIVTVRWHIHFALLNKYKCCNVNTALCLVRIRLHVSVKNDQQSSGLITRIQRGNILRLYFRFETYSFTSQNNVHNIKYTPDYLFLYIAEQVTEIKHRKKGLKDWR
jgi:hypothetical protein